MFDKAYSGSRVLITGHTGFKGSWLTFWLLRLGAHVTGYALDPPTVPSLFARSGLTAHIDDVRGDIRDRDRLRELLRSKNFDFIFHLAAQPLVRSSYSDPLNTFDVNIMGTAALLDAIRSAEHACACVMVSTDKCYENNEWQFGYREVDSLGGHDPYSASKGAMEIVVHSYRRCFFHEGPIRIASARAGNVIGGGDWQVDRIVPDVVRALESDSPVSVRNPNSLRPWQHVLEPLSGYLWLGAKLAGKNGHNFASPWNFGPISHDLHTVAELVDTALAVWGGGRWECKSEEYAPHEAGLLRLSIDKASLHLRWRPVWSFDEAVKRTMGWYRGDLHSTNGVETLCEADLVAYCEAARRAGVAWLQSVQPAVPA